jgi:hypothetical protein
MNKVLRFGTYLVGMLTLGLALACLWAVLAGLLGLPLFLSSVACGLSQLALGSLLMGAFQEAEDALDSERWRQESEARRKAKDR